MKKRCLGSLVVLVVVLVAGAAVAQMDPGPFHILHKQGAIYNSDTGWTLSKPPYYPGTDWAVDFNYHSQGMSILHKDGCIWEQGTGWVYSGYYAGSNYAQALEYLRDVVGCWCVEESGWLFWEGTTFPDINGVHYNSAYPNLYMEITDQIGTRVYGQICNYEDPDGWECDSFEGTIVGDHFTGVEHDQDGECESITTIVGLIFWDEECDEGAGCWEMKGSRVMVDMSCTEEDEELEAEGFRAWKGAACVPQVPE